MAVADTNAFTQFRVTLLAIFGQLSQTVVASLTYKKLHGIFNRILVKYKKTSKWDHRLKPYYLVKP